MSVIDTRSASPIICPFTILIDDREGAPYAFTGIRSDADEGCRPIQVSRRFRRLDTGDYTLADPDGIGHYGQRVTVERKSLDDLFGTLGQGRARFEAEHERMAEIMATGGEACVVVESDWRTVLMNPPDHSRLNPKTVFRTWLSWRKKYGIEWVMAGDRRLGEITTFRILERWWRTNVDV